MIRVFGLLVLCNQTMHSFFFLRGLVFFYHFVLLDGCVILSLKRVFRSWFIISYGTLDFMIGSNLRIYQIMIVNFFNCQLSNTLSVKEDYVMCGLKLGNIQ